VSKENAPTDDRHPWCDTCKSPAVWREGQGWMHSTPEHPFGVWSDTSGHEVTAREWNAKPRPGWEF